MKIVRVMTLTMLSLTNSCVAVPHDEKAMSTNDSNKAAENKERVRQAIQEAIDASVARATHRFADGSKYVLDSPVPTEEEQSKVQRFGDTALDILTEYASKGNALQQRPALRLVNGFKSDKALAVLVQFAEHSRVRGYAIADICTYPLQKTLPILDRLSKSSNTEVKQATRECLESKRITR